MDELMGGCEDGWIDVGMGWVGSSWFGKCGDTWVGVMDECIAVMWVGM